MNRRRFRLGAALTAATLLAAPTTAGATADAAAQRIAGDTRYSTAGGVALSAWTGRDINVQVVATGQGFADALSANYVAGALGSPILLTPRATMYEGLPDVFTELSTEGVLLIGGDGAVNDSVAAEIQDEGVEVTRVAGANRYATARAIAELLPPEAVGDFEEHGRTAILVNGDSYADALSAGPMSYAQGWPVLLTTQARLHAEAGTTIQNLGIEHVIIVGGTGAVSEAVVADLTQLGVTAQRFGGTDRTLTSAQIAEFMFFSLGYDADDVILARGDDFPDALAAGPRGGDELMPILLTTSPTVLGDAAAGFIRDHADVMERIEVFGGTAAVSDAVRDQAVRIARGLE